MSAPCPTTEFSSTDYWLYRLSVTLASVLWSDFYQLHEASRWVFIGFNGFIVYVGFLIHSITLFIINPESTGFCVGQPPVRLPQFDCYAIAFYFTLTLINGMVFKSAYRFGWPRAAYIVLVVAITPLGIRRLTGATLGEMYLSVAFGAAASTGVFAVMTFIFQRLADVYTLERNEIRRAALGVTEFASHSTKQW